MRGIIVLALVALALAGCGKKGDPVAPHPVDAPAEG